MKKNYRFSSIILLGALLLLIVGLIFKMNLLQNISKSSTSNKELNNNMSNLAATCYDINKPVTLNDQFKKNIACKTIPAPIINGGRRVNYYNSGGDPHTPL